MAEDKPNKVLDCNARISEDLLRELRKEASRYSVKGEAPPPHGVMLEEAWLKARETPDAKSTTAVHDSEIDYEHPGADTRKQLPGSHAKVTPSGIELGVDLWANMLRYILTFGDAETKSAICKNLERFHLLVRILNREANVDTSASAISAPPPADIQRELDRVRALEQEHLGDREHSGKAKRKTSNAPDVPNRLPRKRGKH